MRLLIVDIDSLRPDHLGCYGYDRTTSPNVDRIAETGTRFSHCFVSDSPCLPSRTALATCRFGAKNGVVTHHGTGQWLRMYDRPGTAGGPPNDRPLTFQHLSEHGVRTATITSFGKRHAAYHFTASFRESIQPTAETGREQADEVAGVAADWLSQNAAADDWLLHVNFWDVHHPYQNIDAQVDEVRSSGSRASWPDEAALDDQKGMTGVRCGDLWPTPSDLERDGHRTDGFTDWPMPERFTDRSAVDTLVDGYDAAIRKVDTAIGRLLEALEAAGVRDETAIVITGDHGEALGEHGIYAEHALAHPPCQRVPMIVSWPGVTEEPRTVDEFVYQFDLAPTICELAGVPIPAGWDGKSFGPGLTGDDFDSRETLVCSHGIYMYSRAVYHDNRMYARIYHPGVFSHPGLYNASDVPGSGLELLHDLEADPYMTENLVENRPNVADDLRSRLDSHVATWAESRDAAGLDPLVEMAVDDGPFLYVDPEALAESYREQGRTVAQIDRVERARSVESVGVRR